MGKANRPEGTEDMKDKAQQTIEARQGGNKKTLLEQLKKSPIVHVGCERAGISRSTYYRWRKDDKEFERASDDALAEGRALINDMAESQLISLIREKNFPALAYWLRHNNPQYSNRIEVKHLDQQDEELTPEQEALVKKAFELAGLKDPQEDTHTKNIDNHGKRNPQENHQG